LTKLSNCRQCAKMVNHSPEPLTILCSILSHGARERTMCCESSKNRRRFSQTVDDSRKWRENLSDRISLHFRKQSELATILANSEQSDHFYRQHLPSRARICRPCQETERSVTIEWRTVPGCAFRLCVYALETASVSSKFERESR
jgi:hypothetical protein